MSRILPIKKSLDDRFINETDVITEQALTQLIDNQGGGGATKRKVEILYDFYRINNASIPELATRLGISEDDFNALCKGEAELYLYENFDEYEDESGLMVYETRLVNSKNHEYVDGREFEATYSFESVNESFEMEQFSLCFSTYLGENESDGSVSTYYSPNSYEWVFGVLPSFSNLTLAEVAQSYFEGNKLSAAAFLYGHSRITLHSYSPERVYDTIMSLQYSTRHVYVLSSVENDLINLIIDYEPHSLETENIFSVRTGNLTEE